jgi:hypothetical protein
MLVREVIHGASDVPAPVFSASTVTKGRPSIKSGLQDGEVLSKNLIATTVAQTTLVVSPAVEAPTEAPVVFVLGYSTESAEL